MLRRQKFILVIGEPGEKTIEKIERIAKKTRGKICFASQAAFCKTFVSTHSMEMIVLAHDVQTDEGMELYLWMKLMYPQYFILLESENGDIEREYKKAVRAQQREFFPSFECKTAFWKDSIALEALA